MLSWHSTSYFLCLSEHITYLFNDGFTSFHRFVFIARRYASAAIPTTLRWSAATTVLWRSDIAVSSTLLDRPSFVYNMTAQLKACSYRQNCNSVRFSRDHMNDLKVNLQFYVACNIARSSCDS